MLAVLPLLSGIAVLAALRRRGIGGRRRALLMSAAVVGAVGAGGSELSSALGLFTRTGAVALWIGSGVLALAGAGWPRSARRVEPGDSGSMHAGEKWLVAAVAALALAVGVTAWCAAPNTRDALSYHLPRVMHWIRNGSLAHYPTAILRQLTLPPGAELLLAQLRLLAGSDRPFNLIQWLAGIGCLIAASAVAERLGAGRAGQIAAAVFAATIPMAVLQGSSTQNDLVAALWLLLFAYFLLRLLEPVTSRADAVGAGAALGLALLTKPTAWLFALPFAVWLIAGLLRRRGARAVLALAGIGAIVIALNAGWLLRNWSLFGSFPGASYGAANETHGPPAMVSNVVRNVALHLAVPSEGWNRAIEEGVSGIDRAIGADPDDPRTTWKGAEFRVPPGLRGMRRPDRDEVVFLMLHEDQAGAPLHLLLATAAGAAILFVGSRRRRPGLAPFLACVAAGALLFCALLKWQPWSARLHLPLFLLAAPLVGAALTNETRPRSARIACAALIVASLPWALANATRPLLGAGSVLATPRIDQYFGGRPDLEAPLRGAAAKLARRRCDRVALALSPDDPEYLVWVALGSAEPLPRIEHSRVQNRSALLANRPPFSTFRPCATIALEPAPEGSRVEVGSVP